MMTSSTSSLSTSTRVSMQKKIYFLLKMHIISLHTFQTKKNWGTSKSATPHICDLVAHLTVFLSRTFDSRTFDKITVKSATIIKLHYLTLYRPLWYHYETIYIPLWNHVWTMYSYLWTIMRPFMHHLWTVTRPSWYHYGAFDGPCITLFRPLWYHHETVYVPCIAICRPAWYHVWTMCMTIYGARGHLYHMITLWRHLSTIMRPFKDHSSPFINRYETSMIPYMDHV